VSHLEATVAQQQTTSAQQQKEIGALTANLREQAAQIQKVNDRLESSKAALRVVVNDQQSRGRSKQLLFTISRRVSPRGGFLFCFLPLFLTILS
jgi:hypothetical protein